MIVGTVLYIPNQEEFDVFSTTPHAFAFFGFVVSSPLFRPAFTPEWLGLLLLCHKLLS